MEALALEHNLIKRHRPRYNILLRDDKNHPYLKLTLAEEYPRLYVVRRPGEDGNAYGGPHIPAAPGAQAAGPGPHAIGGAPVPQRLVSAAPPPPPPPPLHPLPPPPPPP